MKKNRIISLSNHDRDFFLETLENPPKLNTAIKNAITRYKLANSFDHKKKYVVSIPAISGKLKIVTSA